MTELVDVINTDFNFVVLFTDNDLAVSRQSGKVTFPQNSARSGGSLRSINGLYHTQNEFTVYSQ